MCGFGIEWLAGLGLKPKYSGSRIHTQIPVAINIHTGVCQNFPKSLNIPIKHGVGEMSVVLTFKITLLKQGKVTSNVVNKNIL